MADACLRSRVHYLDITGEIDVFEALAARDAEAKARGVMLLPGVGFDVVPSDCLAAHLKRRLPDANDFRLNLSLGANMSRGTAKTMIEAIAAGTRMRRKGRIVSRDSRGGGVMRFRRVRSRPPGQLGRRRDCFSFDRHSQYRRPFRGIPSDRGVCPYASVRKSFLGLDPIQSLLKSQVNIGCRKRLARQIGEPDRLCLLARRSRTEARTFAHG
jgi:hypothetical protein